MSEIGIFLDTEVLPALFERLDGAFPEFDWRRRGRGWEAGPRCEAAVLSAVGTDTPKKIGALEKAKQGFYCAKTGEHALWVAYVHGGIGSAVPKGADYVAAVRELAELAGVDASHLDAEIDPAERARRRREAEAKMAAARAEAEARQAREDSEAIEYARRVYNATPHDSRSNAGPLDGYLRHRGLNVELPNQTWRRQLRFGRMGPNDEMTAILCPVARGREIVGLQRIAVDAEGVPIRDEDGSKVKKMLGRCLGGAVRIGNARDGDGALWLCEGVETGLAIRKATGACVWATLSAAGLEGIDLSIVPADMPIAIAGDLAASKTGQEAAGARATRLQGEGRRVCVRLPNSSSLPEMVASTPDGDMPRAATDGTPTKSVDWLDVVVAGRGALLRAPMEWLPESSAGHSGAADEGGGGMGGPTSPPEGGDTDGNDERPILWSGQTRRARLAAHRIWGAAEGEREMTRWRIAFWTRFEHWYEWDGTRWKKVAPSMVFAKLGDFFHGYDVKLRKTAEDEHGREVTQKYAGLSAGEIEMITKHMRSCCMVSDAELPCWAPATYEPRPDGDGDGPVFEVASQSRLKPVSMADGGDWPDPTRLLSTASGLLRLDAWDEGRVEILPHTPLLFSTHAVPHAVDADALRTQIESDPDDESMGVELWGAKAPKFMKLLDAICDGDDDKRFCLLEWLGYCLTPEIGHELALLLTGMPGSGKGSFCEAITAMLGGDMVGATSFASLAGRFHAATLMGKMVAVMADAHVSERDSSTAVETAKAIVSGDPICIDEKFGVQDDGTLRLKMVICCNEMPRFSDPSGAWAQRLLVVPMPRGHRRNPDRSIKDGIRREGEGILLAALVGRRRLIRQGRFTVPQDGAELLREYELMNAPVQSFVDECCLIGEQRRASSALLYELYGEWAEFKGLGRLSEPKFHEHLRNAVAIVKKGKEKREGGDRFRTLSGIAPQTRETFQGEVVLRRSDCAVFEFDREEKGGQGEFDTGGVPYE